MLLSGQQEERLVCKTTCFGNHKRLLFEDSTSPGVTVKN